MTVRIASLWVVALGLAASPAWTQEGGRHCLTVIHFFAHPIPDQSLHFIVGGRPLPCESKGLDHGRKLALRNDNLSQLAAGGLGHQAVGHENRGPQQEEMHQRVAHEFLHAIGHSVINCYGVYQTGEV
jgi:hypothetical protein